MSGYLTIILVYEPHLKLCDRYSSVESPVRLEVADGAGDPHGHGGVGDDCHAPVHLPLLTELWCCWFGRAENQMVCLVFMQQNTDARRTVILSFCISLKV